MAKKQPKKRTRKPFQFGLDPAAYTMIGLKAYDRKALEKEYARLRREATERLRRLGKSEFSGTKIYRENVGVFKTLKQIKSEHELRILIVQAARFVSAKGSSATGQREIRRATIESLHASGYTWVNTKNFEDYTAFMEWLRSEHLERQYYHESGTQPKAVRDKKELRKQQKRVFESWLQS